MHRHHRSAAAAVCVLLVSAALGCPGRASAGGSDASPAPESVIRKWPRDARVTARAIIAEYGEPQRFTGADLVWIDNGPWRKTVVYRRARPRFLWNTDKDYLEQTIAYRVPVDKVDDLKRFDPRLEVDESRGLLSSRSDSEALNFLALNLADEVASDKRTVRDAREFYEKTERLAEAGKSSPYLRGLMFPTGPAPRREGP